MRTVGGWGTRIAQQQLATVLWSCGATVLPNRLFWAGAGLEQKSDESVEKFAREICSILAQRGPMDVLPMKRGFSRGRRAYP